MNSYKISVRAVLSISWTLLGRFGCWQVQFAPSTSAAFNGIAQQQGSKSCLATVLQLSIDEIAALCCSSARDVPMGHIATSEPRSSLRSLFCPLEEVWHAYEELEHA